MLTIYSYIIVYLMSCVASDDVISGETGPFGMKKSQKHQHNENRRFYQDLEDDEWHIAHVKDMLLRRSSCAGETYEDRVEKYRKSLENDGGRLEFVQADTLPINQTDLKQSKICRAQNFTDVFIKPESWKNIKKNLTVDEKKSLIDTKVLTDEEKGNSSDPNLRRADDYQYSNDEYYDEEVDFNPKECPPGVLEVHELDIDNLKPYDVECQISLEWRSLDSTKEEWTKHYG